MKILLKDLKGIHAIHFIGIGGAGMSPLAKILLLLGYQVSGSVKARRPSSRNSFASAHASGRTDSMPRMCAARMPSSSPRRFPTIM